jgi:serine/threonine-protein kinase
MAQDRVADFRIVLFGPPGAGKTETLKQLASRSKGSAPISLCDAEGSTILFDYFFLDLGAVDGVAVRFHFYALPGRPAYLLAARMGLHTADGVIFVVDGRDSRLPETLAWLKRLTKILSEVGRLLDTFPMVVQINKVDLARRDGGGGLSARRLGGLGAPTVETQANDGIGVREVFQKAMHAVLSGLGPLPDGLPPHPRGKPRPVRIDPALAREVNAANEIYLRPFSSSTTSYTPHSESFLGAILEKYDLLTPAQVREALALQTRAMKGSFDLTLGEILLKKNFLEPDDLDRGLALKAATEVIHEEILYGKIALERNLVPFENFRKALLFQKSTHFQYGLDSLLLDSGAITPRAHVEVLKELVKLHEDELQQDKAQATGRPTVSIKRRVATERQSKMFFGTLAVKNKFITEEQLGEALKQQREMKANGVNKYVGVILQEMGFLSPREVDIICSSLEKHLAKNPIEGYKIEAQLGRGAMGLVYAALHLRLDRIVALKVLDPKYAMDHEFIKQFYMEAKTAATLNHPNIVQAYDVGESSGYHYFSMEYVEGVTVKQLLEQRKAIEEPEAFDIILQIVSALHHSELNHMVHLDVKPSNIMITHNGVAKLCDLGLSKKTDSTSEKEDALVMGSPFYISPEQIERNPQLDSRADIYSLGATLFHMLTGRPPFQGKNTQEIFLKHLTHRVPDANEIVEGLSPGIGPLLKKMMQKEKEERYSNMEELWAAMRKLRGLEPETLKSDGFRSLTRKLSRVFRRQ